MQTPTMMDLGTLVVKKPKKEKQQEADPHMKGMCHKSYPYYLVWQNIFGKDRATGEHAADDMDIVNDILRNATTQELGSIDKKSTPINYQGTRASG
ncbi:hypothetical protein ACS0TY_021633 [Phlomoides rotata]